MPRYFLRLFFIAALFALFLGCSSGNSGTASVKEAVVRKELDAAEVNLFDLPTDSHQIELLQRRGFYLVTGVGACGVCHGNDPQNPLTKLTGGRVVHDQFGAVHAPNITPHKETGLGAWSVQDIIKVLRSAIDKDGFPLSLDVHRGFQWMVDADAKAIAVYLLSLEPEPGDVERRELTLFQRRRAGLISRHSDSAGYVPRLPETLSAEYGRYLSTNVGGCQYCHTGSGGVFSSPKTFAGGSSSITSKAEEVADVAESSTPTLDRLDAIDTSSPSRVSKKKSDGSISLKSDFWKTIKRAWSSAGTHDSVEISAELFPSGAPDIRGTSEAGLESWSEEEILHYLISGETPSGRAVSKEACPWNYYQRMTESDLKAIARYLKTL